MKKPQSNGHDAASQGKMRKLRSSEWFNDPTNPGMTALYLERYLNYGLTRQELQSGKPIIGIARPAMTSHPATATISNSRTASARVFARPAVSRWSFRPIRSRRRESARPRRSTATSPISAWSKSCSAIPSTAWC